MSEPLHNSELAEWISSLLKIEIPDPLFPALQDGVILCNLIDVINSTNYSIEEPSNIFKKMNNISYFLKGCEKVGIPNYERFESNDLIQGRFKFVEICLLSLSRHAFKKGLVSSYAGPKLNEKKSYKHDEANLIKGRHICLLDKTVDTRDCVAYSGIGRQITGPRIEEEKENEKK